MRKLIGGFAISLDGFIEGPNGEYDWMIMDNSDFEDPSKKYDCFLFGRRSYEKLVNAEGFKNIECYVFSNSLSKVTGRFMLVKGNIMEFIGRLKEQDGKDIAVYGGANLLGRLLNLNLVDEVHFSLMPVLIGTGKTMTDGLEKKIGLNLYDIKTFPSGIVKLFYNVKKINSP